MAVHAHPDDESSKGAASLAKYAAEGVGVVVVSCTGGERGDILNPKLAVDGVDVPALRITEMARAAEILGVAHVWLGYTTPAITRVAGQLAAAGREFRAAGRERGNCRPGQGRSAVSGRM